jgi:monoamine oxidase
MRPIRGVATALAQARRIERAARGSAPARPGTPGLARRAVLRGFAALGAAAGAGAGFAPVLGAAKLQGEVAIIGGGLAGLVALDRLSRVGIPARLYEARPRLGGRILTRRDFPARGRWVEIGGHLVNTDHADMIALAKELGIALLDAKMAGGRDQVLIGREAVSAESVVAALGPIAAQIAADSEALDAGGPEVVAALDRISVADYLDAHAARLQAPGVRALLEQSIRTEFGIEARDASALLLIFNLPTVDGEAYEVLGASDERYIVDGGSQAITDALAARNRARITTGARLAAITRGAGGGVRLAFSDGRILDPSHTILALPAGIIGGLAADDVFAAPWQAFHREVRLGRNGKLNAAYAAAPWRASAMGASGTTWQAGSDPQFCEAWEAAPAQPGAEAALTWFFGGDLMATMDAGPPRNALARAHASTGAAMGALDPAFSGAVLRTEWHRDPLTGGAYSSFAPGQLTRFATLPWVEDEDGTAVQEARDGAVWFAGEHVSDAWSGYMNGAAQTGRLAANALARALV